MLQIERIIIVTPIVQMMVKSEVASKYKLLNLRDVIVGAAPVSSRLEEAMRRLYPHVTCRQGSFRLFLTQCIRCSFKAKNTELYSYCFH